MDLSKVTPESIHYIAWSCFYMTCGNSTRKPKPYKNTKQSGDESESGKTYKKKLQERLFSGSQEDGASTVDIPTHPKRKRSHTLTNSDHETFHKSPKKKRIKTEPESDVDVSKVHKKHKSLESTKSASNDSYDEDYLDSKVKDEQNFAVPSAVKSRKSRNKEKSSVTDISLNNEYFDLSCSETQTEKQTEGLSNAQIHYEDESNHIEEESRHLEEDESMKKKKSKKKRMQSESEATRHESSIKESFFAEETVIEQHEESQQNSNKTTTVYDVELTPNGQPPIEQVNSSSTSYRSIRNKASISERITFEDEDSDGQTESVTIKPTKKNSSKLNAFLESSETLRPILSKLPEALVLNEDDDMWVIRCPKDVNVEAFQDKKWTLDSKCKIKLSEKTYEGCLEDEKRYMTVMTAENDRRIIKNFLIMGCVTLRRRIPKAHIHDTNIMVNNQNFIPLPDTKCRHPLFGSNYRKAIKLPSAVRERLQAAQCKLSVSIDKKKKKKKNRKSEQIEETFSTPKKEHAADAELTELSGNSTSKKKKKKRRYTVTEEESRPKKIIKHNPESVEAWESEKAIEENLFNF